MPPAPPERPPGRRRHPSRWLVLAVMLGTVGCDQASKRAAVALLPEGRRVSMLADLLRLEHARNPGGFLGAGAGLGQAARTAVFVWGVAVMVLVAGVAAFSRRIPRGQALGAALVAGGGLGNLLDRALTGGWVIDFMNLGVGPLRTGIFNAADVAIVAGFALLALLGGRDAKGPEPARR